MPILTLQFKILTPPTPGQERSEMTFAVPLLDTAHVGEILQIEQTLNRITAVRWHLSVEGSATVHCTGCGTAVTADLVEYNSSGTQRLCPVCAEKQQ